jgi:hypothetical protein
MEPSDSLISEGEILDKPQQFLGTSVVVKVKQDVHPMITTMIEEGWEPHYVIIYGNVKQEIVLLGQMLNIETYQY